MLGDDENCIHSIRYKAIEYCSFHSDRYLLSHVNNWDFLAQKYVDQAFSTWKVWSPKVKE